MDSITEILKNPYVWVIGGGIVLFSMLGSSSSNSNSSLTALSAQSLAESDAASQALASINAQSNAANNQSQAQIYETQSQANAAIAGSGFQSMADMVGSILGSGVNQAAMQEQTSQVALQSSAGVANSMAQLGSSIAGYSAAQVINGQNTNSANFISQQQSHAIEAVANIEGTTQQLESNNALSGFVQSLPFQLSTVNSNNAAAVNIAQISGNTQVALGSQQAANQSAYLGILPYLATMQTNATVGSAKAQASSASGNTTGGIMSGLGSLGAGLGSLLGSSSVAASGASSATGLLGLAALL